MSKSLEQDHSEYLDDMNLKSVFAGISDLGFPRVDENRLIAFVIFGYDPDSQKLNIEKDRYENKYQILKGLGADADNELFEQILTNANDKFNMVVLNYLETLTNWRWQTIYSLLDYHSNMIRFANQKTEEEKSWDKMSKEGEKLTLKKDYDVDTVAKVNESKGKLLTQAIDARRKADLLLDEIRKTFMVTDNAVQQDLGFTFTDTAKKPIDILSWRSHVVLKNSRK